MKNVMCLLVGLMIVLAMVPGCQSSTNEETGEKEYQVPPKVDKSIEGAGSAVEAVGPAVVTGITMINAVAGGAASVAFTTLMTVLGLYRKWKKPLVEKSVMLDKVTVGLRAAGDVIEQVVKPNAELWSKDKPTKAKTILLKAASKGAINADML